MQTLTFHHLSCKLPWPRLSQWLASLASFHAVDPAEDPVSYNGHVLRFCSITATKLA